MKTLHYVLSEKIFSVTGKIQQDFPGLYEHLNETPHSLNNYNKIEIEEVDLMHYLEELIFQMNFFKKQRIDRAGMKNLDTTSEAISKNWIEQKEKLLEKYSILNETDLLFIDGKKELMLEKVRLTLRITKEELSLILSGL
jgi:glutamine synthetase type III